MPELCRFWGLLIKIQYQDHSPPHIHVWYGGKDRATIGIRSRRVLQGSLPSAKLTLVLAWILLHEDELEVAWERAKTGKNPGKIDPLR
jgi:hypothetical protein